MVEAEAIQKLPLPHPWPVSDNRKEVESRYTQWKKALQDKEMKINVNKTKRLFMLEEIFFECKFENILALYAAKKWKGTLCSVQNVATGFTGGVQEFIEV